MSVAVAPRGRVLSEGEREALAYRCPLCGAGAGVWCRAVHSRARRRPPAVELHVSRGWASRPCPTCGESPGRPCVGPTGRPAREPHAARRPPAPRPGDLLGRLGEGPRAAHAALLKGGAMTAVELAREVYGPGAPARRVTNQLVALRRRRLATRGRSSGRWEAADV